MLDIGSGWGRWLIGGANKGYIPIGIDIRLEFAETQQTTLQAFNKKGYSVVGDLESLPFLPSVFDLVWSFSVIQHTHYKKLISCLKCINLILKDTGFAYLEFPNKNGIRNKRGPVISEEKFKDIYDSWRVRYYTVDEYRAIVNEYMENFSFDIHSFLGIGVLKEDLKYVSFRNKIACSISLLLSSLTFIIPGLKKHADSIYVKAYKKGISGNTSAISTFLNAHNTGVFDNLNIVPLLQCPKYGTPLKLSKNRDKIISEESGEFYPIINNIPVLVASEANKL